MAQGVVTMFALTLPLAGARAVINSIARKLIKRTTT
jgi:hypothetical protein